jgi:hypothetical protein
MTGIPAAIPFAFAIGSSAGSGSSGDAANTTRSSPDVIGGSPHLMTAALAATATRAMAPSLTPPAALRPSSSLLTGGLSAFA